MSWKIPLFKMYWDNDDIESVENTIRSGMNWASGPDVPAFEEEIARYIGTRHCLTFNSGTSALHAALVAHGIGKDDEVIVPSFTFIATANAPLFVGARPVFADIDDSTYGLDPEDVNERITRKTKAIIPVHYGGCPCHIRELREIADDRHLVLIEDAAESFGAKIQDRMTGSFGDSSMVSFCQNKIITTGEGGAIVTNSRDVYEKMKLVRSHGRLETADYFATTATMDYITLGYNFRMSSMTAALGRSQLRKVEKIISTRRADAEYYIKKLSNEIPGCVIASPPRDYYPVYQLFSVQVKQRDALMHYLEKEQIMTKVYFSPVHKTHYYKNIMKIDARLPRTESVADTIISLPFYPGISGEEIDCVVAAMKNFYGEADHVN
jgi:perosamine synthetase